MNIPLLNRLKKKSQRDVALLEDVLVRMLYEIDSTAEVHGGTVVWRCFGGRRFSKDVDVYLKSTEALEALKARIPAMAGKYGAKVLKFKDTGNLVYAELLMGDVYSEIDINYKRYYGNPEMRAYENLDGSFYDILIPSPEDLLLEKIDAYNDRRSISDIYDMRVLIDSVKINGVKEELAAFLSSVQAPAREEERRIGDLIYEGPIPTFNGLIGYLKGKMP